MREDESLSNSIIVLRKKMDDILEKNVDIEKVYFLSIELDKLIEKLIENKAIDIR